MTDNRVMETRPPTAVRVIMDHPVVMVANQDRPVVMAANQGHPVVTVTNQVTEISLAMVVSHSPAMEVTHNQIMVASQVMARQVATVHFS